MLKVKDTAPYDIAIPPVVFFLKCSKNCLVIRLVPGGMEGLELFSNCSNGTEGHFTVQELKKYNLAWSISGLVMAAVTLASFIAFILIKAYRTPLQRLFLSLTFFTILDLTNNSINLVLQRKSFDQKICQAVGYIDVSIFITSLFLTLAIAVYLLAVTYHHIQGKSLPKVSKLKSAIVEVTFLILVVAIPPVALQGDVDKFGVAGPYCWMKVYDGNCEIAEYSHHFERKVLTVYTLIMAINISIFTLLIMTSCLLAYRHENVRQHHVHVAKKASLLVFFLSLTFVIDIITYWCHYKMVETEKRLPLTLLIILGTIIPISPVFIPLGFSIYLYSMRSVKLQALKERASKFGKSMLQRARSRELILPQSQSQSKCDASHTMSQEVGYTGGFTDAAPSTYGSVNQTTCAE